MGCLGGARALCQDSQIGSIEEGKKADLVVLRRSTSLTPLNNLIDQLALCENGDSVESVLVDGRPIMIERRILTVETEEILGRLCSFSERIRHARDEIN
jgi:5-methylthioadenosine/S-adenosylhomocysteine deaminase